MSRTPKNKNDIVEKYREHDKDAGSTKVQIAVLTRRIQELTEHLKVHRKDYASRRGLLVLVGRRSSLLRYLKRKSLKGYQSLIADLGIRK